MEALDQSLERLFIGIDPGNKGGIAIVDSDGRLVNALPMPTVGGKFSPKGVCEVLRRCVGWSRQVFLEHSQAMPDQGRSSIFNYAAAWGAIEGILVTLDLRYELVRPQTWQKVMHAGTDKSMGPKERSLIIAQRLLSSHEFLMFTPGKCKKPQDGLIDAYLLAEHGRRLYRKEKVA